MQIKPRYPPTFARHLPRSLPRAVHQLISLLHGAKQRVWCTRAYIVQRMACPRPGVTPGMQGQRMSSSGLRPSAEPLCERPESPPALARSCADEPPS